MSVNQFPRLRSKGHTYPHVVSALPTGGALHTTLCSRQNRQPIAGSGSGFHFADGNFVPPTNSSIHEDNTKLCALLTTVGENRKVPRRNSWPIVMLVVSSGVPILMFKLRICGSVVSSRMGLTSGLRENAAAAAAAAVASIRTFCLIGLADLRI